MSSGAGLLTNHPMSESTRTTADGGTSDALDVEALFATDDTDISIDDGESDDRTTTANTEATTPGSGTATPDAEDTTADELFAQLRDEHDDAEQAHAVDDVTDESPEDIMARADEDAEHVDQIDDSIRADEGALDDLLLTERREADGFLWVETDADDLDAPGDDGFSLDDDIDESFEARAATFDTDDFGADAAAFDDGASDDAEANENDDSKGATEDARAATEDARADVDDAQAEDGDDDGADGLAARIRSILTG